jgi:hypothetical protein
VTEVKNRIVDLGAEPVGNSRAAFDASQAAELTYGARITFDSGAKAE